MSFEGFRVSLSLGQGMFGKVHRAVRLRDNLECVIKQVPLGGLTVEEVEDVCNEARLMSQCDHFNIIQYYESFIELDSLYIVMEYAAGGDLGDRINRCKETNTFIDEEMLWTYLIQICQGLKYLHQKRILHRDIKPRNIFLDGDGNIKIGDMGLGRALDPGSQFAETGVGTPLYFSPEMCQEKPYNQKSDIWAFGCLMYELASREPPFMASNHMALAKKIVHGHPKELPTVYSKELQFLIFNMLEKEPDARPNVNQILSYSAVKIRMERAKLRKRERMLKQECERREASLRQEFSAEIRALSEELQSRRQEVIHLREAKRAAEERFRKLEQSCDQLSSEVTEYRCDSESQMNLLRREAEANQENLRRAGETIRRLEGLVRRYEDELKIAQESAPVQDSSLAKELQKQHELTNDLLTEVEERESKVALKWAEIADKEKELRHREQRLKRREQVLQKEMTSLQEQKREQDSRGWRLQAEEQALAEKRREVQERMSARTTVSPATTPSKEAALKESSQWGSGGRRKYSMVTSSPTSQKGSGQGASPGITGSEGTEKINSGKVVEEKEEEDMVTPPSSPRLTSPPGVTSPLTPTRITQRGSPKIAWGDEAQENQAAQKAPSPAPENPSISPSANMSDLSLSELDSSQLLSTGDEIDVPGTSLVVDANGSLFLPSPPRPELRTSRAGIAVPPPSKTLASRSELLDSPAPGPSLKPSASLEGLKERIDSARKSIRANASPPSSRKRLSYAAVTNASRGNEGGRGSRDGMLEESSVSVSFSDLEKQFEEIQRELHPAKSPCVARESFQSSSPRRDSAGCKSGDQSSPPTCERVVGGAGRTPSPSEASRKSPVSSSDESGAGSRSEQSKRSLVGALAAVGGNADSSSHRIKNSSNRARGPGSHSDDEIPQDPAQSSVPSVAKDGDVLTSSLGAPPILAQDCSAEFHSGDLQQGSHHPQHSHSSYTTPVKDRVLLERPATVGHSQLSEYMRGDSSEGQEDGAQEKANRLGNLRTYLKRILRNKGLDQTIPDSSPEPSGRPRSSSESRFDVRPAAKAPAQAGVGMQGVGSPPSAAAVAVVADWGSHQRIYSPPRSSSTSYVSTRSTPISGMQQHQHHQQQQVRTPGRRRIGDSPSRFRSPGSAHAQGPNGRFRSPGFRNRGQSPLRSGSSVLGGQLPVFRPADWGVFVHDAQTKAGEALFPSFFAWRRVISGFGESGPDSDMLHRAVCRDRVWDSKGRHRLITPCGDILIIFQLNDNNSSKLKIRGLRLRCKNEVQFQKLRSMNVVSLQQSPRVHMINIPHSRTEGKEVEEFILDFESANPIDELYIIKRDPRLLEAAGLENVDPMDSAHNHNLRPSSSNARPAMAVQGVQEVSPHGEGSSGVMLKSPSRRASPRRAIDFLGSSMEASLEDGGLSRLKEGAHPSTAGASRQSHGNSQTDSCPDANLGLSSSVGSEDTDIQSALDLLKRLREDKRQGLRSPPHPPASTPLDDRPTTSVATPS